MLGEFADDDRVIDAGGVRTSLLDIGDGAPLLLLHGGIECGGAMWGTVLPALAKDHRIVVPDVPASASQTRRIASTSRTFKEWLRAVIEETGLDCPVLVALTIGSLAARFASLRTGLISRLVVYGAPAVGPYRVPMRLRYIAIRFGLRPTPRNAERFERFALFDLDSTRDGETRRGLTPSTRTTVRASIPHVRKTMRKVVSAETKPILDRTGPHRRPTTLIWGRHDRMVPLAIGQAAAARHGWPLHVVEGAAHVAHMEQPEAFVATLQPILAS